MHCDPVDKHGDWYGFERDAWHRGCTRVAGVDEVGRGPLAGPVVAAAVILPVGGCHLPLRDSKALSARQRDDLDRALRALPGVRIAVAEVGSSRIDAINILRATHEAMRAAVLALHPAPDHCLVDGLRVPEFPVVAEFIVRGDARSASIAAASIVAKVYRDRLMRDLGERFPEYGFARHKGYATGAHLAALRTLGPLSVHRFSFAPVAAVRTTPPVIVQMELPMGDDAQPVDPISRGPAPRPTAGAESGNAYAFETQDRAGR